MKKYNDNEFIRLVLKTFSEYNSIRYTSKILMCSDSVIRKILVNNSIEIPDKKLNSGTKFKDRSGEKHNSWTILKIHSKNGKNFIWECICDCGNVVLREINNICSNHSKKCVNCANDEKKILKYDAELSDAIWNKIILSAKRRNIFVEMTKDEAYSIFLKQNKKCLLSGLEINFAKNPKEFRELKQTASLDRINSDIGYVRDNLQWVHKDINLMKNVFSQDKFIELCKLITKKNEYLV